MLPAFKIDHSSFAILLGEAKNSKSFSTTAWGHASYEKVCDRFYKLFEVSSLLNIEKIKKELDQHRIKDGKKFDNFALDYISEHLKDYAMIDY